MLRVHPQKWYTWNGEGGPRDVGAVEEGVKGGEAACLEEGAGHGFGGEGRHQAGGGRGGGGWVEQGPSTAAGSQE